MYKRKKILHKRHTASFALKFSAAVITGFAIFGLIVITFLNKQIGPTYADSVHGLNRILHILPRIIVITTATQAIILSIIATLLALFWSHSIAGPLVRFRKCLKDIPQGNLPQKPVTFRETDQLQAMASALSEMIISKNEAGEKTLSLLADAQKILDEYKTKPDSKLNELKEIYSQIKKIYAKKS